MDEEKKTTPAEQPQPPAPLSDARKAALLRYMAILFAVAFLLVLLSLILQTHSSKSTISELSAASTSALDNAVKLQEQNRALQEEKQQLEDELDAVQKSSTRKPRSTISFCRRRRTSKAMPSRSCATRSRSSTTRALPMRRF